MSKGTGFDDGKKGDKDSKRDTTLRSIFAFVLDR
jgi:hypothetical protein